MTTLSDNITKSYSTRNCSEGPTNFLKKLAHSVWLIGCLTLGFFLSSCDGVMNGIYDEPDPDWKWSEGIAPGSKSIPNHYIFKLEATNYNEWVYVDLHQMSFERMDIPSTLTGVWDGLSGTTYQLVEGTRYTELSLTKTDPMPEPEKWDLAIHHFDVKTNHGVVAETTLSDISKVSASTANGLKFEADRWSENQVIVDISDMMAFRIGYQNSYVNFVITQWATMDFSTPPPIYGSSGKVYLLKMTDQTMAALKMRNYVSPAGTKGYLTIEIVYPL